MNIRSFYYIYYAHRIKKASILLKAYIIILLPITYFINKIYYPKICDLDIFSKKNKFLFTKDLNYLFQYFNSDKGDKFFNQYNKPIKKNNNLIQGHSYHTFYEKYFKNKKNLNLDILELGAFKGNAAAAFYFYLKNSKIVSCDLFPDLFIYKSKKIKNIKLNTGSEVQLKNKIINKDYKFDIIIEDVGHFLKDQIISLFCLFKTLKTKGIFIIEELDFPDTRKDMNPLNEKPSLKEILLNIKNSKNFNSKYITEEQKKYFLENVDQINIFKGRFNEIAFITKK